MNQMKNHERVSRGFSLSTSTRWVFSWLLLLAGYVLCDTLQAQTGTYPNCNLQLTGVVEDVTCAGSDNGAIDVTVAGGTQPYTYNWSTGDSTEDIDNLAPGIYFLTVYDAYQCDAQAIFVVNEPDPLRADVLCEFPICGGQPDCCLFINGGTMPYYVFVFYAPNNNYTPNNLPDPNFSGNGPPSVPGLTHRPDILFIPNADSVICAEDVPNGTYYILVVDDNLCWTWEVVHINAIPELSLTGKVKNVSCFGDDDGAIDITVSGGTPPYSYSWSNGANTEDIDGLTAGIYTVKVEDDNGCKLTHTFVVRQPDKLKAEVVCEYPTCWGQPDCCLFIKGGTGPYTIWVFYIPPPHNANLPDPTFANDGTPIVNDGTLIDEIKFTHPNPNVDSVLCANGIPNGIYYVLVVDANGCWVWEKVEIDAVEEMQITGTVTNVSCYGDDDGAIDISVTGGTPPYVYKWSTGAHTEDIHNLSSGVYKVTVYDDRQCHKTATFVVRQPDKLRAEVICEYPICGGQPSCCLFIKGGTEPYRIFVFYLPNPVALNDLPDPSFNSDGTPDVPGAILHNDFGLAHPGALSDSMICANGVPNGTYYILVVDANGCWTWEIVHINADPPMEVKGDVTNVTCFGDHDGSIDLTVTGGSPPYHYKWSTGATTEDIHNLSSGVYKVKVEDENGCVIHKVFVVRQPDPLELNLVFDKYGDSACVSPTGGTPPYSATWIDINNYHIIGTGRCVEDLDPGFYLVIVEDVNGCDEASIFIIEPRPCVGGVATVDPDTINSGENTTFFLTQHSGSGLQWQFRTDFTGWVDIFGATSPTYTTPNIYVGSTTDIYVRAVVDCGDGTEKFSTVDTLHVIGQGGGNKKGEDLLDGKTLEEYFGIEVFPTISDGRVNVRFNFDATADVRLRVSDLAGKVFYEDTYSDITSGDTKAIDIGRVARGMYLISSEYTGTVSVGKVIVQ